MTELSRPTREELEKMISTFPVFRYFEYSHLPLHLQRISAPFAEVATKLVFEACFEGKTNSYQETAAGLRKLLEAKDCFVRAAT